jgi:hypothetical protein
MAQAAFEKDYVASLRQSVTTPPPLQGFRSHGAVMKRYRQREGSRNLIGLRKAREGQEKKSLRGLEKEKLRGSGNESGDLHLCTYIGL